MELFFFGRFHVRADCERAAEEALRSMLAPTRGEAGCVAIHAFRSTQDHRFFYIHSRWRDQDAFDLHASLPHTVDFIKRMASLIDRPAEFTRTELVG